MNPAEERQILSVLEAIGEDASRSQRHLSGLTGLNLAKVNFVIKRLTARGLVTLHNVGTSPNKLRYLYVLTPAGVLERSRLTYRFIQRTLGEYAMVEARVRGRLEALRASGVRRVALCGADAVTRSLAAIVDGMADLQVTAVYDGAEAGARVGGHAVLPAAEAPGGDFDRLVVFARQPTDTPSTIAAELGVDLGRVVVL